jgi:hypothetical protein
MLTRNDLKNLIEEIPEDRIKRIYQVLEFHLHPLISSGRDESRWDRRAENSREQVAEASD